jgi:hypothetical protein
MAIDLEDLNEDDWAEFERVSSSKAALPDAQARITKTSPDRRAQAWLAFRGEVAAWFTENQPRFKIYFGGKADNLVRIVPDLDRGRFEVVFFKGTARLSLGRVNVWPDEPRDVTPAEWVIRDGALVLRLPETFSRPTRSAPPSPMVAIPATDAPPAKEVSPAPQRPVVIGSGKPTAAAPAAATRPSAAARVIDRRVIGAVDLGEPPAGRSALDQRRAGGK